MHLSDAYNLKKSILHSSHFEYRRVTTASWIDMCSSLNFVSLLRFTDFRVTGKPRWSPATMLFKSETSNNQIPGLSIMGLVSLESFAI